MLSPISVCFILGILSDTLHSKRKELENKHYFDGLNIDIGSFCDRIYGYILKCFKTSDLKRIFVSGDGAKWINNFASILRNCFRAEDIDVIQVLDKKPASSGIQLTIMRANLHELTAEDILEWRKPVPEEAKQVRSKSAYKMHKRFYDFNIDLKIMESSNAKMKDFTHKIVSLSQKNSGKISNLNYFPAALIQPKNQS